MAFVKFTRPDNSSVIVNADQITQCDPVPSSGPLMGPLSQGTRITFANKTHQDVVELIDEVQRRLSAGT